MHFSQLVYNIYPVFARKKRLSSAIFDILNNITVPKTAMCYNSLHVLKGLFDFIHKAFSLFLFGRSALLL